jgi:transaldolase
MNKFELTVASDASSVKPLWATSVNEGETAAHHHGSVEELCNPEIKNMNAPRRLHNLGQSIWLDNVVTRDLLNNGALMKYIDEMSVTGLTSNLHILHQAIKNSTVYDTAIHKGLATANSAEGLYFDLTIEDVVRGADSLRPIFNQTNAMDGWASLEMSPLLAHDSTMMLTVAKELYTRVKRPNVLIKIPGTKEGLSAIEEAIFAGVPVNATLLFSRNQYVAAAEAYMRGIERRIDAGLNPHVGSVASVFISRWDSAVADKIPSELNNQLGIAVANLCHKAYRNLVSSPRWQRALSVGARPQRLLWASTGTNDPSASKILYVNALAAPFTVNTMSESTLMAFAKHGEIGSIMPCDGGNGEELINKFTRAGVNVDALATQLQETGVESSMKSWTDLMELFDSKISVLLAANLPQSPTSRL